MAQDKYLTYRGEIKAIAPAGATVLFVTAHPEGQVAALYRLDSEKQTLDETSLPGAANDVVTDGETAWIAGADRRVHRAAVARGGKLATLKADFETAPSKLALVTNVQLAAIAGQQLVILSAKDGAIAQSLDLPESATAIATDPTGQWLVIGTVKGNVLVFESEDRADFLLSESSKLHDGAVTALLFEPDDLRFLSAGVDGKLLSTHARGKLEPEDKGRGNNHTDAVTALTWLSNDRFVSGSLDSTVKNWPRAGAIKPATTKDGLAKVKDLCVTQVSGKPQLVAACEDNSLRFFPVDAAGKIGDLAHRIHGAAAWAKHELSSNEVKRREAALRELAAWNDTASIEQISQQSTADSDNGLRLLATQLLAGSNHPRAAQLLEKSLLHPDEAIRVAAFAGLIKVRGERDLRPLDLALAAEKADIGPMAVRALASLAGSDDQALARLTQALDRKPAEVRQAALAALETVTDSSRPDASLMALGSKHADLRRLALLRLYQRKMLQDARVQTALRRASEDADAEVRRVAFLLSLHTRERLAAALRSRDAELERQMAELESAGDQPGKEAANEQSEPKVAKPSKKVASHANETSTDLEAADYEPLLQATASRSLDTCLRGARGLAVLRDERAMGLLLQLSREKEASARVEVARALAALDDPRSAGRLRSLLFDADAAVRDAAFTALIAINASDPLAAADAGLGASQEDVRRRGLEAVIAAARKRLPESAADPAWPLFIRALNDASPIVRSEAFKAALNLGIGGGRLNTLRFVLQSVHADVRREVLTEAMAQAQVPADADSKATIEAAQPNTQPWAWGLVLEFLADPDAKLRDEAFEFATKKSKDLGPLEAALASRFSDVRRKAVAALIKRHTRGAQALLVKALADEEAPVRLTAIDALVGEDVRDALQAALNSPHDDVHARAAKALARHGDVTALPALIDLISPPEPQNPSPELRAAWMSLVQTALEGLAELGDPASLGKILPLLESAHAPIRKAAGRALAWAALGVHPGSLRQAMQHADPQVRFQAALGLALGGEASAAPLVFGAEAAAALAVEDLLAAAVALGSAGGEDQLIAQLDSVNDKTRAQAVLLLMLLELKASGGSPSRCLACLASRWPRVRLRAARGLDSFRDPALFLQFVTGLFNDRTAGAGTSSGRGGGRSSDGVDDEAKPWSISASTVDAVAALVAFGTPAVRARTSHLLVHLFENEQAAWDRAWELHAARFAKEVAEAQSASGRRTVTAPQYTPEQLEELAFGAYVGLVREQGDSGSGKDAQAVGRVRQTALTWLGELARRDAGRFAGPARAVLMQALRDPNQPVRTQAFDQLIELKADATTLGAEALEAGHIDLGVRGLELLSGAVAGGGGREVLEQTMLTRTDDLATEAAKLLIPSRGVPAVAAKALDAGHELLRLQAVTWLASAYEQSSEAQTFLRNALSSRYGKVRDAAAWELATKKDPAAFEALVKMLNAANDEARQRVVVDAFSRLGDPRTPGVLLDRIENDPAKTAASSLLFNAAGLFRDPTIAGRLLEMFDRKSEWRLSAGNALLTISGHQQPIDDPEEERPANRAWEQKQFPRHDAVLAGLMNRSLAINSLDRLTRVLTAARWSRGGDVNPVLAQLVTHPDERLRHQAVEAVAWRVRKRGASPEPLRAALAHRDPTTQFLAAEGLARAGRGEGLSILLSAIDFLSDIPSRRRAVQALGELGDVRALDTLLKIANEDGHVLRDMAAEAIGRMGASPGAGEVFALLERLAKTPGTLASNALRGLRWLDTPDAWRVIRGHAAATGFAARAVAVELLRFEDSPENRELLLKLIADDGPYTARQAMESAKQLFGEESLEPHYAWLQTEQAAEEPNSDSVSRVGEKGDAGRIFALLPKISVHQQETLATFLLKRQPLPEADAAKALAGQDAGAVRVAARILGRAGSSAGGVAKVGPVLTAAIEYWQRAWDERRHRLVPTSEDEADGFLTNFPTAPGSSGFGNAGLSRDRLAEVLRALLWAAGRLGVAQDSLIAAVSAQPGDTRYRPVRLEAVSALSQGELKGAAIAALEAAATDSDDPQVRALAADAVASQQPKRAVQLAERVLPDRLAYNRLAADLRVSGGLGPPLGAAAAQGHYQGIALPHLVASSDVTTLATIARDRKLPDLTRLGAIEGLGRILTDPAAAALRAIGADDNEADSLRKTAWRALRRWKRAREDARPAEVKA